MPRRSARVGGILLTSAVVGIGIGWIVGYAHFVASGIPEESGRNALAGGIAGLALWPVVYLKLIRPRLDLEAACVIAVSCLVFGLGRRGSRSPRMAMELPAYLGELRGDVIGVSQPFRAQRPPGEPV